MVHTKARRSKEATKIQDLVSSVFRERDDVGWSFDNPPQPFAERLSAKIHKQPDGLLCEPDVRQQLFAVHSREALYRFYLNYELPADEQVDTVSFFKRYAVKLDREKLLTFNVTALPAQPLS